MKKITYTEEQKETIGKMAQQFVDNLNKNVAGSMTAPCPVCERPFVGGTCKECDELVANMNKYKVFKYDSRNTGYYIAQDLGASRAREMAIAFSKMGGMKAQIEAPGYFETYEKGEKTAWSA